MADINCLGTGHIAGSVNGMDIDCDCPGCPRCPAPDPTPAQEDGACGEGMDARWDDGPFIDCTKEDYLFFMEQDSDFLDRMDGVC